MALTEEGQRVLEQDCPSYRVGLASSYCSEDEGKLYFLGEMWRPIQYFTLSLGEVCGLGNDDDISSHESTWLFLMLCRNPPTYARHVQGCGGAEIEVSLLGNNESVVCVNR